MVFTTPAVHALRRRFPDATLTYLVEPGAAPIVTDNPHLDEVIVAPRRRGLAGLADDISLGRSLRARRFELAIDFHGGPRASILTWLSGAQRRVGYAVIGRSWMYTHCVPRPRELRRRHSVENQWDLILPFGVGPPDPQRNPVEMAVNRAALATVTERLNRAGVVPSDRLVVIHVSAGNPFRRWPIDHFVSIVRALAADERHRIVVTSGPSEREAADRVVSSARLRLDAAQAARVLSCGELSIGELRALFDRAALFIGGDSGPLHVAATASVPIVGLYGPTLPERSAPWRNPGLRIVSVDAGALPCRPCDQRVCVPGDFRCLTSIRPERVLEAALRCLEP